MRNATIMMLLLSAPLAAQELPAPSGLTAVSHVVMPQTRGFPLHGQAGVAVEAVQVKVRIVEGTARTTLDVQLRNRGGVRAEAVLLVPVPDGAVVSAFDFEGAGSEPSAALMPADEARRLYESIVARVRDPALLEFAGHALVKSSVFPVEPGGTQRVRIVYEHVLDVDGGRFDYLLPRSESLDVQVPWDVEVSIEAGAPVSMVYSPTHDLETERVDDRTLRVRVAEASRFDPGAFRLSFLLERDAVTASLFAYPDPSIGGGYFLLMAGTPAKLPPAEQRTRREVTLVLDRSGSMAGIKMDQVRAAALQVIEGLHDGETFNIVDYATTVERFSAAPVVKGRETVLRARSYLESLRPNGGTNIHDALVEALRQPPTGGMLPIVLFLTDGLPTVGRTAEPIIRRMAQEGNPHQRRIFAFGVGNDVNVPLLDGLADDTRALATYVLPQEDVELKVAQVFRRLYGPVLSGLELRAVGEDGVAMPARMHDLTPELLPDLYEGDPLIVLGKYRGEAPLHLRAAGDYLGERREFAFSFALDHATVRNAFVPRLWAGRRIAYLADQVRQLGAGGMFGGGALTAAEQARYRELADEILRLSTEFGVLSEYTSFLATEGSDLGDWNGLVVACRTNLDRRAVGERSGAGAVSQGRNFNEGKIAAKLNYQNGMWNADLKKVEIAGVQQVADRCFFQRGAQWIDGRLVAEEKQLEADVVIEYGSTEHMLLVRELAAEGRSGVLALRGEILLEHAGRNVLVRAPEAAPDPNLPPAPRRVGVDPQQAQQEQ